MRTKHILSVTFITIVSASLTYFFLQGNSLVEQTGETKPLIGATTNVDRKSMSISDEEHNQPKNSAQRQLEQVNDKIATLETRLRYLEISASEQAKNRAVSSFYSPLPSNSIEKSKVEHSEINFIHRLDESLNTGHLDRDMTIKVTEQAEKSLANVPNIILDDMQCDERFCQVTITPDNGKQINISQVLDASANFMGSGTVAEEPDGSLKIYFTQAGQSLSVP